jgi:hypothetical protein
MLQFKQESKTLDKGGIRHLNRRLGFTLEFEAHVRSILACGCSARQARDNFLLNARYLLPPALVPPSPTALRPTPPASHPSYYTNPCVTLQTRPLGRNVVF